MENWVYDEFIHCGVDYSDIKEAEDYDNQHERFRDYEKEVKTLLKDLDFENTKDMSVIDLGCGTGAFGIYASKYFKKIYGIDASKAMLEQAIGKTKRLGITNVEYIHSGFLHYDHKEPKVDLVVTKAAFHHLPDFWKQVALLNMNKMLKIGGVLYIFDVVFRFEASEYKTKINNWIESLSQKANLEFKKEIETHIKDEFSTFGWVLEGMIERAGFKIELSRSPDGLISEYFCKKIKKV